MKKDNTTTEALARCIHEDGLVTVYTGQHAIEAAYARKKRFQETNNPVVEIEVQP